jgi:Icc-related predicted phosphoesterase
MRLAVTSDLHFDFGGHLTSAEAIEAMVLDLVDSKPDAVVLAGDIAAGFAAFEACLAEFKGLGMPVGVVPGNHDLWRDDPLGLSTEALWGGALEEAAERQGLVWLETKSIRVGDVAVVGSMGWYDYSAVDASIAMSRDELARVKSSLNADARKMDWRRKDPDFALELERALLRRIDAASTDPAVRSIAVVTHVPLLEAQMTRKPDDPRWGTSNAYYGNLTTGRAVMERPKVKAIVSGHSHVGHEAIVERAGLDPVVTHVVPSDYGKPKFVIVDL